MITGHSVPAGARDAGWRLTVSKMPHLWLLLGSVVAIALASSAIAGVLTWLPRLGNESASVSVSDRHPVTADIGAAIDPAPEENAARGRMKCEECGVVESTREIVRILERMDSSVAVGVKRTRLKELAGKSIGEHVVTVRMKDGATHQFMVANPENWRPGERVIFIEGRNRLSD